MKIKAEETYDSYICDRCGNGEKSLLQVIFKLNTWEYFNTGKYESGRGYIHDSIQHFRKKEIELCEDCYKKFQEFWQEHPEEIVNKN